MKILADRSLPYLHEFFPAPFVITLYTSPEEIPNLLYGQEILLCRSTLKVTKTLIEGHQLKYIATASSGTDHIDATYIASQGMVLLDAKGSNAQAVTDYVQASLAYLQQYKQLSVTKAGIIGVGAVGSMVAARLKTLAIEVIYYDPPLSTEGSDFASLSDIIACDLICVHANLHDQPPYPSRHLLKEKELALMRPNTAIINASRGDIISEQALLRVKPPIFYCTDVFCNEPAIDEKIVDFATLCTPHIAGHSVEGKMAAVMMLSQKLHEGYGQTLPHYPAIVPAPKARLNSLENHILSQYNPMHETQALKAAQDKKEGFLSLRTQHYRHHFA